MEPLKTFFITLYKSIYNAFENELFESAGFVAYTILLSLFPFLILLISIGSRIGQTSDVQTMILYITEKIPPEISEDIIPIINNIIHTDAGSLVTLSAIGIIWVASSGIESMRLALNKAYEAKENRNFIILRGQSIMILIVGIILLSTVSIGLYLIPALLGTIPDKIEDFVPMEFIATLDSWVPFFTFSAFTRNIVTFIVLSIVILILYRGLPNHKHNSKKPLLPGTIIAAALCLLFSDLFSYFLRNFAQYHTIYKSLGGVVIFMLYIQFSTFCILLGAQFNTEIGKSKILS